MALIDWPQRRYGMPDLPDFELLGISVPTHLCVPLPTNSASPSRASSDGQSKPRVIGLGWFQGGWLRSSAIMRNSR